MKIRMSICYIFLLLCPFALAQQVITGTVADSATQKPLPFVNIGIPNKNIGTVSTQNGDFKLAVNPSFKESDTIVFSYIGYAQHKIVFRKLQSSNNKVFLKPAEQLLKEVAIHPRKMTDKIFGWKSKGLGLMHWNFYTAKENDIDDRLSKEIGLSFKLKNACRLKSFNLAITTNEFKSVKFRVNIYNILNGKPDSLIISDNIILEVKDRATGWHSVDLKPYNIFLDKSKEEILISIQWVASEKETDGSKYFAVPAGKSPFQKIYYREKAMDEWKSQSGSLSMYLDAKCAL